MKHRVNALLAAVVMICLVPAASFALVPYGQDFESMDAGSPSALADDGWLVFGNVFDSGGGYQYGYGPFAAPNGGPAFSAVVVGQGGPAQGDQQLSAYNDYNNQDHGIGFFIEANLFQEQPIGPGDVGETWVFFFESKLGNLEGVSTAAAFIKTLDPDNGFITTNFITQDMTSTPTTWTGYTLSIVITPDLDGQILQIGFSSLATNFEGSGVFYDNVRWFIDGSIPVEENTWGGVKSLYR